MPERTRLTTVETVRRNRSWLFTVRNRHDEPEEVILVECEGEDERGTPGAPGDGVRAWVNRCTHEAQALDRGFGAAMRDGEIVCPKHGSMFDACAGDCDNGDAAGTTLVPVDVECEDGVVYLLDGERTFLHEGGADDGNGSSGASRGDDVAADDVPSSSSHIGF